MFYKNFYRNFFLRGPKNVKKGVFLGGVEITQLTAIAWAWSSILYHFRFPWNSRFLTLFGGLETVGAFSRRRGTGSEKVSDYAESITRLVLLSQR